MCVCAFALVISEAHPLSLFLCAIWESLMKSDVLREEWNEFGHFLHKLRVSSACFQNFIVVAENSSFFIILHRLKASDLHNLQFIFLPLLEVLKQ